MIEARHGIGITLPSVAWVADCVKTAMASKHVRLYADRVIALGALGAR